jgi:hypothetical protein
VVAPILASATPTAETDGIVYSKSVPLTSNEADLWGGVGVQSPDPIPATYGAAIIAVVQLSINGLIVANNTYIGMQIDLGDGVWIDLNWCVWTGSQGSATFVFSNGVAGANTIQQSRNSGSPPNPQANGSNQLTLGGRIRFVGQTQQSGGSSSLAGVTTQVSATIKYKLLPLN